MYHLGQTAPAHLDMSHIGYWVSSLADNLPLRSRCTFCVCFTHSCVQRCSQQHLLATHCLHMHRIWSHFILPRQYHSTSQSESLKPPWAVYRFISVHLCRWIHPQLHRNDSYLFHNRRWGNCWHTSWFWSSHYFADKICMLNGKHASCLFLLSLLWSPTPLTVLHRFKQQRPCWVI